MKVFAFTISLILMVSFGVWGQNYTANVRTFGLESGLSHNDAREVALDARGMVWVGTRNGLNRFDGKKFKSFFTENGLKENNIESLIADGEILICIHKSRTTEAINGITLFHSVTEQPIEAVDWLGRDDIAIDNIVAIDANDKEIVFCVVKDGIASYFLKQKNEKLVEFEFDVPTVFVGSSMDGTYWFHEWKAGQLVKRDLSGKVLKTVSTKFLTTWPGQFYVDMRFGEHEEWLYAYDSLYQINGDRLKHINQLWGISQHQNKLVELPSEFVRKHPYTGLLWFSVNSSSYLMDSAGNIHFSYTNENEYVNNEDLFIKNVVLQPTSNGLKIISLYPSKFENFGKGPQGRYRGIAQIGKDYLACNDLGVRIIDSGFNKITKHISYVGNSVYKLNDVVYTIGRQSINKIDANQKLLSVQHLPFAHEVWGSLVEDSFLYYSTYGFRQFNLKTNTDRYIKSNEHPEINTATIYAILPKSENEFWLCSTRGLFSFNKETEEFAKVLGKVNDISEYQHLYQEADILWLASGGTGLVKYNLSTTESKYFSFTNRNTNVVHAVYPDKAGNLWLSTDHGIVRFNKSTEEYRLFKESDGLIDNEFNRISHFKEDNGTIVFGGVKGIVRFHPDSLKDLEFVKPVLKPFVADVWLYKSGESKISQVTNEFNNNGIITINPQDRFLSFDLATTSIEYYNKVEFAYLMDDDEEWKSLPSNKLEFNVLPFGKHEITIAAGLPDGQVSKQSLSIKIEVLKPIYLQTWFLVLVIMGLLFISVFAVIIRTKRLEKQKLLLESEIEKRTQKIVEDKAVIEKQAAELKSLDNLKNRFFANISHELRNPLTLILGPVENLLTQEKVKVPSLVRSQMVLTLKNAKRLQKRINEILALSKIDAGKIRLTYSAVNANRYFKRVVLAHSSLAKSKNVDVVFENRLDEGLNLNLDSDNVEKVLNNILSNAIKHSPPNTVVLTHLESSADGVYSVSVIDEGEGIEDSEKEKIFDRYYQSKSGQKAGGTGLGLALSKELSKIMGGNIVAENIKVGGAKFTFSFKAESTTQLTDAEINEVEQSVFDEEDTYAHESSALEANVLVVEDNEEMRGYIKGILGSNFRVFEAENGKEALSILSNRKIDLITSDLMMPVMDGLEFLQVHKDSEHRQIPVIMVTARADDSDRLNALEIGVDDYITKPFFARELMARVNNLLKNRRQRIAAPQDQEEVLAPDIELQVQRVVDVVKEHLAENDFSVSELAEKVGYSERQLRRILKKEKGVSPTVLIKELRLNHARRLLETQQFATVAEVMYASGFKSPGHFNKGYFERFGKKPTEYFE